MSDDHFDSEAQGVQTTAQKTGLSEEVTSSLNSKDIYPYWKTSVEEDRKAAKQVEQRVLKARESRDEQDVAAQRVQQQYKAYSERRSAKGMNLSTSARWSDGIKQRKLAKAGHDQDEGKNDASSRWQRTGLYATQISQGKEFHKPDEPDEDEEVDRLANNKKERKKIREERKISKEMEYRYWLEMVDSKHRYASNLKWYHQHWNENVDTNENFFHWLDEGSGKDLELDQCPRARLDKERITYLTAEQRRNYLVEIDDKGRLAWKKNGEPIDTTRSYRDAGPNVGIVKMSDAEVKKRENDEQERRKKRGKISPLSSSSSESSDPSEDEKDRQGVKGYHEKGFTAGSGKGFDQVKDRVSYYASPRHVMDHMLRKSLNKNTWLYVADLDNNMYVGIKKTGEFQHSSFLYGARVTSAGLLKVDNGKLTSLSPLSGHYKSGSMHFKAFLRSLEERGVDLSSVMISKSILTIRGIEKYGSTMKKKKQLGEKFKVALHLGKKDEEKRGGEQKGKTAAQTLQAGAQSSSSSDSEPDSVSKKRKPKTHKQEPQSVLKQELPAEGKRKEDMTDDERLERGLALVQRAFERGMERANEKLQKNSAQETEQDKAKKAEKDREEALEKEGDK